MKNVQAVIKNAPKTPGCYIFRNKKKKILYIGKAINIRSRVKSYFQNTRPLDPKISIMVKQISNVEFVITDTEIEALILETNLIKKYKPKYNSMMKDDKNYAWLMITKGEDFPRLEFVRKQKINSADYFGPYIKLPAIKRALKGLRKIFPYRSCNRTMYFKRDKNMKRVFICSNKKPCLYYHLDLCDGPCTGNVKKSDYRKNINKIKYFFRSKKFKITDDLNKEMSYLAKESRFEKAAIIRDKLRDLRYITERVQIEKEMDEQLYKQKRENSSIVAVKNLIDRIKFEDIKYSPTFRIECYDISNISGKSATGSMVVFTNGKPDKKMYRKFKIRTKDTPDDFIMLQEVFQRRFHKEKKKEGSFSQLPDLIIVDGGKGQLSSTLQILNEQKINIPVIGLAKKDEELFKWIDDHFKKIKLRKGSYELFLVQKIRDEAHRFAIKYHKVLRSKDSIKSVLDDIPGVGDLIKKRLLKAFGSTDRIKKANTDELQAIVKNKKTVENIQKLL